jgi:hypothetical protein
MWLSKGLDFAAQHFGRFWPILLQKSVLQVVVAAFWDF